LMYGFPAHLSATKPGFVSLNRLKRSSVRARASCSWCSAARASCSPLLSQ
jgi:hypothetical protein